MRDTPWFTIQSSTNDPTLSTSEHPYQWPFTITFPLVKVGFWTKYLQFHLIFNLKDFPQTHLIKRSSIAFGVLPSFRTRFSVICWQNSSQLRGLSTNQALGGVKRSEDEVHLLYKEKGRIINRGNIRSSNCW